MFRTVPLSIISSFSLYTHQWYMSYRLQLQFVSRSGRSVTFYYSSILQYGPMNVKFAIYQLYVIHNRRFSRLYTITVTTK